ncbi:MAG: dynamin, partial [Cyanobacteria bacterium P01_F01_bin.3]
LTIFFLINGWDWLRNSLVDPEDTVELEAAAHKIRQVFQPQLQDYCQVDGIDCYDQRVFEISALQVLRQQLKAQKSESSSPDLSGTSFPEFLGCLQQFLAQDRAKAELQRVAVLVNQVYRQACEAIERRIPLLDETTQELKDRVESVQTEFQTLIKIRDNYQSLIRKLRDQQAQAIADSFKTYILNLEETFEEDFASAQPDLDFVSFLNKDNRSAFYSALKRAFERYINDRLAAWEFIAKQDLSKAFSELQENSREYQSAYAAALEAMHEKLIGNRFYAVGHSFKPEETSVWADGVKDLFESIPDTLNTSVNRFNYFWQSVLRGALVYVCISVALSILGLVFSSLVLNVVGVLALGGGALMAQAEFVRQQFLSATKQQFVKHLPQIADEQWRPVYKAVENCFDVYEKQIIERITADITARRLELDSLLAQKESHQINRDHEIQRLNTLKQDIASELKHIELLI